MTPAQAAYRAGAIVSEVEHRFAGERGLSPACLGNCSRLPARVSVYLRHLWPKALRDAAVLALLDGFDPPAGPLAEVDTGPFWIGYYHQRAARGLPPDFGPRLKTLREKAGLSGAELAEKAGTSRQQVFQLERGDYRPTWDMVQQLATALSVPTDTFRDPA